MTLPVLRRRALALEEAVRVIEAEFGNVVDMTTEEDLPMVTSEYLDGRYPAWVVVSMLQCLRDRYASDVLATAERGA